jgi:drug/metabolite transporter (DMT)-like permease
MAVLLAALSALTFGAGDFSGGLSARRIAAQWTTAAAQATGLVLIVIVASIVGGSPGLTDMGLGIGAGLCGGAALVAFYWAMAQGPMSVVAPLSAVMSAVVPTVAGMVSGERPSPLGLVGIVLALPAIVLISREPEPADDVEDRTPATPRVVVAATLSGVGFGLFFTLVSRTAEDSGVWPLAGARSAAIVLALLVVVVARPARPTVDGVRLAMLAGCLDSSANVLFLLASRQGLLTLVGVIGAMYPASTVVLARVVLGERLARHQLVGLAIAAGAVVLIATA